MFRKILIANGFVMIQYSVYVRTFPNREFAKKFLPKLKAEAPNKGNVHLITITKKQYNDMELIVGCKKDMGNILSERRIIVI